MTGYSIIIIINIMSLSIRISSSISNRISTSDC